MRFLLHQVVSVSVLPLELFILVALMSPFPAAKNALFSGLPGILFVVHVFASGPVWGYVIPRTRDYSFARWTWIIPSCLFLAAFIWEGQIVGLRAALSEFFDPRDGDEGLGLLVMIPAASAVLYSIGAAFGYAKNGRMVGRENTEIPRDGAPETIGRWLK